MLSIDSSLFRIVPFIVPDCSGLFRWCWIGDIIGDIIGAIIGANLKFIGAIGAINDDNKEFVGDIFL